ncbi:MAG: hypothetical protein LBK68_01925 [Candidatus Margulisbacteria bacterium]|nr:hypothetical protein [Candidatus Margulisiibacteriota bacterium]
MTEISNHPYHFSVPAPKDSPYAKYDMSRAAYSPNRLTNNMKVVARTPAEQTRVADGKVDVNDVGGFLITGRIGEVDALIEQLKSDGKLTEAEKVARIKEDFEKDRDLYLKNFTEWRNSDGVRERNFIQWADENGLLTTKQPLSEKLINTDFDSLLDLSDYRKTYTLGNIGIDLLIARREQRSEIQNLNRRIEELEKRLGEIENQNQDK